MLYNIILIKLIWLTFLHQFNGFVKNGKLLIVNKISLKYR